MHMCGRCGVNRGPCQQGSTKALVSKAVPCQQGSTLSARKANQQQHWLLLIASENVVKTVHTGFLLCEQPCWVAAQAQLHTLPPLLVPSQIPLLCCCTFFQCRQLHSLSTPAAARCRAGGALTQAPCSRSSSSSRRQAVAACRVQRHRSERRCDGASTTGKPCWLGWTRGRDVPGTGTCLFGV
jgi:hypothetical protein